MKFIKHLWSFVVMILCFFIVAGIVWYCLFGSKPQEKNTDGTLVKNADRYITVDWKGYL